MCAKELVFRKRAKRNRVCEVEKCRMQGIFGFAGYIPDSQMRRRSFAERHDKTPERVRRYCHCAPSLILKCANSIILSPPNQSIHQTIPLLHLPTCLPIIFPCLIACLFVCFHPLTHPTKQSTKTTKKPDFSDFFQSFLLWSFPVQILYPTQSAVACLGGCLCVEISFSNVDQRFLIVRLIGCLG